jgi:phage FluMu protein Com
VTFALESVRAKSGDHYDMRCPRCRTVNKVPLKQLEREAPPPAAPGSGEA